jgi:4-hydroxy-2-oxoheptanedioate aldolase
MRSSKVLAKLRSGQVAWVCSIGHPMSGFPALAAHLGYDGIWVDGEHRPWDPREVETMMLRHHLAGIDCVWRPPTKEKSALYRLLEDGATGLMIPHVSTPEAARELVQAVKFPPAGDRGLDGSGLDANHYVNLPKDYTARANAETFLVVQIETPQAVEHVDAIAAVPGVDVLFIGPGDLSLRLGCGAGVDDAGLMQAQRAVADAARRHQKAWGRPVSLAAEARTLIGMGAQFIAFGSAFWAVHQHLTECARQRDALLAECAPPAMP